VKHIQVAGRRRVLALAFCVALSVTMVAGGTTRGGEGTAFRKRPPGTAAFFLRGNGRRYLALMPLAGGATRLLELPKVAADGDAYRLEFSANGRRISFLAGGSFFVVETASLRITREVAAQQLGPMSFGTATLSPDGRYIAVVHNLPYPNSRCEVDAWISVVGEGGESKRFALPPIVLKHIVFMDDISWSPDSGWLAYTVNRRNSCDSDEVGTDFLFRISASGKGAVRLRHATFISSPLWSRDGRLIAYVEGTPGAAVPANVFIVRPNGSARRKLSDFVFTISTNTELSFVWSKKGTLVAAYHQHRRTGAGLYEFDARGRTNRRVSGLRSGTVYAVSNDGLLAAVASEPGTYDPAQAITVVSVADGKIVQRTRLKSPRPDLRREKYPTASGAVAVSFAPQSRRRRR
jgi:hypothetical protein